MLEGKTLSPFHVVDRYLHHGGPNLKNEPYFPFLEQARNAPPEQWGKLGDAIRFKTVREHLGVGQEKIHIFRHEDCHKAYGFYSSPRERAPALMLTIEGGGDD